MKKRKTVEYDYESVFDIEVDSDALEEHKVKSKDKSVYATKEIYSGEQLEVEIYPTFTKKEIEEIQKQQQEKEKKRNKNKNDKKARKEFTRLANANFNDGDYWLTLTYNNNDYPVDMDEALKNMKNYIRRINRARKKANLENAKYMYITEWTEGKNGIRCHHHMLIDKGIGMEKLEGLWTKGRRNQVRKIKKDEYGLAGMANYLTKNPKGSKRWCRSTNLKKPVVKKNHYKFKKSRVNKIVKDFKGTIAETMESTYKNYIFTDAELYFNYYNNGYYIYARLRKKE